MNWGDIRDWDPDGIDQRVDDIISAVRDLRRHADELEASHPRGWHGAASDAARAQRSELVREYADIEHAAEPVWKRLHDAATEIRALQRQQDDLTALAQRYYWRIDYSGAIGDTLAVSDRADPDFQRIRQDARRRVSAGITEVCAAAARIDAEVAATMRRAHTPTVFADAKGKTDRLNLPPEGTDPKKVSDWWQGLSDTERAELIGTAPARIGNLDGIPFSDRHEANMVRIPGSELGFKPGSMSYEANCGRPEVDLAATPRNAASCIGRLSESRASWMHWMSSTVRLRTASWWSRLKRLEKACGRRSASVTSTALTTSPCTPRA